MQGSRIAHSVTAVESAREPRLTVVNSYQSLNPFSLDRTIWVSFRDIDGPAAPFEFARHVAWRARGQLEFLMGQAKLMGKNEEIAELLATAAAELNRARDLITGRIVDKRPYKPLEAEDQGEVAPVIATVTGATKLHSRL